MNRIDLLFKQKDKNILSVYFTAGYPRLEDTIPIIRALQQNGVDLVEIGIPFSDPLADGKILQLSNQQALRNGMTLQILFSQLQNIREEIRIPLILMGYLNPVLRFGMEKFCETANRIGIDGIILPDLPPDIYQREFKNIFMKYGLYKIFLIAPETGEERIRTIDREGNGFIYMVSSSTTTGSTGKLGEVQTGYFKRIHDMKLRLPGLVGFGISSHETFMQACKHASGAIIGSAFVGALGAEGNLERIIKDFVNGIRTGEEQS
ncbi:MAG: tryptophan synthase subunit alpha [Bacteroides sp. SM23_62_1]|nr:MAG: tryptophan synthase subunit alpha [Bacteroides sp. SM23_62_1]